MRFVFVGEREYIFEVFRTRATIFHDNSLHATNIRLHLLAHLQLSHHCGPQTKFCTFSTYLKVSERDKGPYRTKKHKQKPMKEDEEPNSTEEIQELFFRLVKQEDFQQIRKLFGDEAVVVAREAATTKNNVEEEEEEESSDFEQTPISRKKQQIAKFAPKRKNPSMIPNAVASPSFSHSAVVSKTTWWCMMMKKIKC